MRKFSLVTGKSEGFATFFRNIYPLFPRFLIEEKDCLPLSMFSPCTIRLFSLKKVALTLGLCAGYLLILMTSACMDSEDAGTLDGCPRPKEADALGIKAVFFSPYLNNRYSVDSDTVPLSKFGFNFELEIREKENQNSGAITGQALALSCIQTFNIRNISNISVVLTSPFAGLPIGTDISYLLVTPDDRRLSELREFENVSVYFGTSLKTTPTNFSQLKTRTFLFLRNGTQVFIDSTSPYLKTN